MNRSGIDALLISLQIDLDTIGLKQLHYTLLDKGYTSVLLYLPGFDRAGKGQLNQITSFFAAHAPRFVGISLMSHEHAGAVHLTRHLKQATSAVPIVWGGIHPTIAPETCLDHADYICVGEGERAVTALAGSLRRGEDIGHIHNLWYRRNGRTIENPLSPLTQDLDGLPVGEHLPRSAFITDRNRIVPLDEKRFKRHARWRGTVYSIMGSRGCPFACAYCCNDALFQLYGSKKIRRRSVAGIISELTRAVADNPQIDYVNFQDDCFLACSDAYLEEFCAAYRQHVNRPLIVRCIPSYISEDKLIHLKAAGLAWISLGLQSGSDRVLTDIYNRRSTADEFLAAARVVHRLQIAAYYDVILDNPLEKDSEKIETINVLTAVPRPFFLQLFSLTLYPGTAVRDRVVADFPELADQYLKKDYHRYRATPLNRLIRTSAYLPPVLIRYLAADYDSHRRRFRFRLLLLNTAALFSALIVEPLTYFRVIRISRRGSVWGALRQLPAFFRVGFSRYTKQFSGRRPCPAAGSVRDGKAAGKRLKKYPG